MPNLVTLGKDPTIVKSYDEASGVYSYQTRHFHIQTKMDLHTDVLTQLAYVCESTLLYARALPLGLSRQIEPGTRYRVLLYEHYEDYVRNGGFPGSAGIYLGHHDAILIPLLHSGIRRAENGTFEKNPDQDYKVIIHEVTHLLTPKTYFKPGVQGWLSEGVAEYLAFTDYSRWGFRADNPIHSIRESDVAYGPQKKGGRVLGEKITMPDLKDFMLRANEEFREDPNALYGRSLLLVTYFLFWDEDGNKRAIQEFLQVIRSNPKTNNFEEAYQKLLGNRTTEQLEEQIATAWRRRKVYLSFL